MYEILLVCIVILLFLQRRERFSLFGFPIVQLWPNTCDASEVMDAGLCYKKCNTGYNGIGPVCWKDSIDTGTGTPVELEDCPEGWNNWGLVCQKPMKFKWLSISGGQLKGRLDNGGKCPQGKEKIAGLCYKKCPTDWPYRLPWPAAQRCAKVEGSLSYGRGAGTVPPMIRFFGRYTF